MSKIKIYSEILKLGFSRDESKRLERCDIIFICHDVDRPIKFSGKSYAPLCDSIRQDYELRGYRCLTLAHFGSHLTGKSAFGNPISSNRIYFKYLILRNVHSLLRLDMLFKKPSFYNFIFSKTKPKIVFVIGATDDLCHEARKKQIVCVEILHGIGYKFIPWGWDKKSLDQLPTAILSLDSISSQSFLTLSERGIKIFTIPNPFLKRFLPSNLSLLPDEWKTKIGEGFKKKILISLVWGYWGDHGEFPEFSGILSNGLFYEEISDCIKSYPNIFWCFRLHPVQLSQARYSDLRNFLEKFVSENANCEWKQSSTLPYPVVAAQCSGNIGMSSMSCYDAAAMGVPSLMLCPTVQPGGVHESWYEDLVEEGYVCKCRVDIIKLKNWIESVEKIEPRLSNLNDEDGWENAVEWLLCQSGLKRS
jgi:hypothetical protein